MCGFTDTLLSRTQKRAAEPCLRTKKDGGRFKCSLLFPMEQLDDVFIFLWTGNEDSTSFVHLHAGAK